jgi:hypothetical protein
VAQALVERLTAQIRRFCQPIHGGGTHSILLVMPLAAGAAVAQHASR